MDRQLILRNIFFVLFTLSGFSGLIYESIWSHYLKLFLGHAAYAQTLVLVIFMGGMAIGSWLSSHYSTRWKHLLLGYAVAEGIIGLCAIVFHPAYVAITDYSYDSIMPALGSPATVTAFKWSLAGLLILPQSILLGMTFPLMSAGIIRHFPGQSGYTLSMLYFTNSLGAAAGVLVSGFVLISSVGLPGTILTAGLMNIGLALVVWVLLRTEGLMPAETLEKKSRQKPAAGRWYGILLLTALITGLSSFIYEISWIRMLSLVLGASTHAFELMLSAFILGLALGGYWIKRRIEGIKQPVGFLAIVQIAMGLLALLSLPLYGETFWAMRWLMTALSKTAAGYDLFNLSSHFLTLIVMLPATFCAGMTLPLITFALIKQGQGEKSIGAVYATNTAGAIAGILFAVHVGLPWLGLKNLMVFGAALDIGLGIALLWLLPPATQRERIAAMGLAALGVTGLVATIGLVSLDSMHMASGVYRVGGLLEKKDGTVEYQRDGKTATVTVTRISESRTIRTNGKPDASVNIQDSAKPVSDEATGILTGALPAFFHPRAKTAAVIGIGSGMTSHTLLAVPTLEHVDTIEIEPAMVEGARLFAGHNDRVFTDPRSRIHIEDAKTYFSAHNKKYDIIISEPSNPWVSGVSGLFSQEFYRRVTRHLQPDGLFMQWLQLYEIDIELTVSVFRALNTSFGDYTLYLSNHGDLLILARVTKPLGLPDYRVMRYPQLAGQLRHVGIRSPQDLELRRVGTRKVLNRLLDTPVLPVNSDYFPVLDQNAARTRFMRMSANELVQLTVVPVPLLEMLDDNHLPRQRTETPVSMHLARTDIVRNATILRDYFTHNRQASDFSDLPPDSRQGAEMIRLLFVNQCDRYRQSPNWRENLMLLAGITPHLTPQEMSQIWESLDAKSCIPRLDPLRRHWVELLQAVGARNARAMAVHASALLKQDTSSTARHRAYLLATGMLGHLALGERKSSRQLWYLYSKPVLALDAKDTLMLSLIGLSQEPTP